MATGVNSHCDILGQPLNSGDVVAYRVYGSMAVGRVVRLTAKRVRIQWARGLCENLVLPQDTVKLDSAAATMYMLRSSHG